MSGLVEQSQMAQNHVLWHDGNPSTADLELVFNLSINKLRILKGSLNPPPTLPTLRSEASKTDTLNVSKQNDVSGTQKPSMRHTILNNQSASNRLYRSLMITNIAKKARSLLLMHAQTGATLKMQDCSRLEMDPPKSKDSERVEEMEEEISEPKEPKCSVGNFSTNRPKRNLEDTSDQDALKQKNRRIDEAETAITGDSNHTGRVEYLSDEDPDPCAANQSFKTNPAPSPSPTDFRCDSLSTVIFLPSTDRNKWKTVSSHDKYNNYDASSKADSNTYCDSCGNEPHCSSSRVVRQPAIKA